MPPNKLLKTSARPAGAKNKIKIDNILKGTFWVKVAPTQKRRLHLTFNARKGLEDCFEVFLRGKIPHFLLATP